MRLTWLSGLFICLMFLQCREKNIEEPTLSEEVVEVPADFVTFYEAFHADSAYQMQHIIFPLDGKFESRDSMASKSGSTKWSAEEWQLHRPFNSSSSFERELSIFDEALITEYIYSEKGFGMQRRFAKLDEEWHLIYYSGMRQLGK